MRVTVRVPGGGGDAAKARVKSILTAVDGVIGVEPTPTPEAGDDLACFRVEATGDVRAPLVKAVVGAGLDLLELSRHDQQLESVFLRLAGARKGEAS